MITFGPMTLLAVRRLRRASHLLPALLALAGAPTLSAGAQSELSHLEDAAPVPRGMLRLRLANVWTTWDQRFSAGGPVPLGSDLSADPLGSAQFPRLTPIEQSIQALAADPTMRLSLGRLVTRSDARVVTTPIVFELGLTPRLSVGVTVPVVQTRRVASADVNSATGTPANVGFVQAGQRGLFARTNQAAYASYQQAAANLAALITQCRANPGAAGCVAYNADAAGAAQAQSLATAYANAIRTLGTDSTTAHVAPRAAGTFAVEIEMRRNALNAQLQRFLGGSPTQVSPVFFATTDFSYIDLQGRDGVPGLLQSNLGGGFDSLHTSERIGVGDISVGAQYLVFDRFQRDTLPLHGLQTRLAVGGAVRFATSRPDTATNLTDIGTGQGAAVEVHSALDLIHGRVGGTVGLRYLKPFARTVSAPVFGDREAPFPFPSIDAVRRTAGDVLGLELTPRFLLSETFAIDGRYGWERVSATSYAGAPDAVLNAADYCAYVSCQNTLGTARTSQRLGLGLRYSTVDAYLRGRARYPVEVSYAHLTTVSGDPGVAKESREQIQLRIYYRLFGQ